MLEGLLACQKILIPTGATETILVSLLLVLGEIGKATRLEQKALEEDENRA